MASAVPALDYSRLPAFGLPDPDDQTKKPSLIGSGIATGFNEAAAQEGSAIRAVGDLTGISGLSSFGQRAEAASTAAAAASARPDLEGSPFDGGISHVVPWAAYNILKGAPQFAAIGAAAAAAPEAAGARLLAGGLASSPFSLGQAYQATERTPGGQGDAVKALTMTPALAALSSWMPGHVEGLLERAAEGGLARHVATSGLVTAAVQVPAAATQTAILDAANPDLTPKDRIHNIVDAAMAGGVIGGFLGGGAAGIGGLRGAHAVSRMDPSAVTNADMSAAVDNVLALPAPPAFADSSGRVAMGSNGAFDLRTSNEAPPATPQPEIPQAAPALIGPDAVPDRSAIPGSTVVVGRRDEGGRFTNEATGVEQPPVVPEDTSRAFRNFTDAELSSASNALANKQQSSGLAPEQLDMAKGIEQELEFRRQAQTRNESSTSNDVTSEVSRSGDAQTEAAPGKPGGDGETGISAPAPATDWNAERDDLLKGISTRPTYKDIGSKDDLAAAVKARLEAGSTAKGDFTLAERLGIDTNEKGAPVEAAPARAEDASAKAPVADTSAERVSETAKSEPDPAFADKWKEDVKGNGQRTALVSAMKPVDEADAQRQIYHALGSEGDVGDGLERLAQKYGVLDDEKRLTPLAVDIASKEPITTETAVKAAMSQGFKGADASAFSRGVQDYVKGDREKAGSQQDSAAYTAGAKFAEETNSVPSGALKKYDPSRYTGDVTDKDVAAMNGTAKAPETRTVPPEAREQQSANNAIDSAGISSTAKPSDIALLKRMVREGDIKGAMDGLKKVQAGGSLHEEPAPVRTPFKGESVLPGAPKTGESTTELAPTKSFSKASAEAAIRKHELTQAIEGAHAEGAIDSATRMKLIAQLRQGRVGDVAAAIPTKYSGEKALRTTSLADRTAQRAAIREQLQAHADQAERDGEVPELKVDKNGVIQDHPAQFVGNIPDEQARAVQTMLEGKSASQVADLLAKHAPNGFAREVATKIGTAISQLSRAGIDIHFKIAHSGDQEVPALLHEARGLTTDGPEGTTVWLNGMDGPGGTGLSYEVALHEMLHAVTMQSISWVEHTGKYNTPLGKAVQDLQSVSDAIKAHFSNRQAQGNLTPMEKWIGESNALDDPHETLAWALSSPEFQSYLDTIDYTPKQTLWGRFVQSMRVFLGLGARGDGALNEVLRASEQIMSFGPAEMELAAASGWAGEHMMHVPGDMPRANEAAKDTMTKVIDGAERLATAANLKGKALDAQLYVADKHHLVETFSKWFKAPDGSNPLHESEMHEKQRSSIVAKMTQMVTNGIDAHNELLRTDRKSGEKIPRLQTATEFPFDPTRAWRDQSEEVRNQPGLQGAHSQYYNLWRGLSEEGRKVYSDLRSVNDVQLLSYHAALLHAQIVADTDAAKAMGATIYNTPTDKFMGELKDFAPSEARAWWSKTLADMQTGLKNYIAAQLHGKDTISSAAMRQQLKPLTDRLKDSTDAVAKIEQKPYFHLPRFGDFFVDFKVKDQGALAHIADALEEKKFGSIISKDSDQNHVFMRLENVAQQKALYDMIEGFKAGDNPLVTESKAGQLSDESYASRLIDTGLQRLIESVQNSSAFDDNSRTALLANLRKTALDLMPESAIARVMTNRKNVPGYSADMMRGFAQRAKIGADSLSNLVVGPKIAQSFTDMRGMIADAQKAPTSKVSIDQRNGMQKVVDELSRRLIERSQWGHNEFLATLSKITSAHYLGLSPAFAFVQFTQLGATTLPELGSQHGYVAAAKEMAKATPAAFNIMRQVFAEGKRVSTTRAMDAVLTRNALERTPGVTPRMADFLMQLVNTGQIDIGGQIRELVRTAEAKDNAKMDTALRYATAMGYYAETGTRLIAAIATYNLNPEMATKDVATKAARVLDESLFNFSPDNWGRLFGKKGFLGEATPLATKFMQYNAQVMGKLYREVGKSFFDQAGSKEERDTARRFLAGHLASMTLMAGTLGLPLVTVFAAAYDRLKDMFSDGNNPSDIRASYRQFLTDVFGHELEPILSKGAFRLAGTDVTQRIGEQDLLPFSRFIADRRKIKDSLSDLESRSWGAPTSMVASYANGISRISNGDLLGGAIAALPTGLANPLKAYRMAAGGKFVDASGTELPMTPSTRDIVLQATGFNPGQNADYSDRQAAEKTESGELNQRGAMLRDKMLDAMDNKDEDKVRELIPQIRAFDQANPTRPSILGSIESAYSSRVGGRAAAAATEQPLGVKPGTGKYNFGNIEFAR